MNNAFLSIENLTVTISGHEVLKQIQLVIGPDEQWAVVGPTGSGKTVFAETLAGKYHYQGTIRAAFGDADHFHQLIGVVSHHHRFRDLQNRSDFYYQQRYQSFDAAATMRVLDDLEQFPDHSGILSKQDLLEQLQIIPLLEEPLIQLSNGEHKRLQLAKALLTPHKLLVLDQPFTGLDTAGRNLLKHLLQVLMQQGARILLICAAGDIPDGITHVAMMKDGRIESALTAAQYRFRDRSGLQASGINQMPAGHSDAGSDFEFAVKMIEVQVEYGQKTILQHINWEVKKGSCWSLSGPNGAGKSTLLSLITGDNPQAYANEIYLFDRRRGTGESIWDIKSRIGFLSPELHLYFDPLATCYQAVASGFFDTIGLFRRLSADQEARVHAWLDFLDLGAYRDQLLNRLPAGLQRLVLLARAMVKAPPLLVLDEPCQGLDAEHIALIRQMISLYCRETGATLIFVSHYPEELPDVVDRFLRLERGIMT